MLAALDLGTNTVRLLLGEVRGRKVVPHAYHRAVTRLGGGFSPVSGLAVESQERTLRALAQFSRILQGYDLQQVAAVGTEILRQASNAADFLARIEQTTPFPLQVISGGQEARLSATGVLSALEPCPQTCLIVDIGGGSTEFVLATSGKLRWHQSYPLGVVRLAEGASGKDSMQKIIGRILDRLCADLESAGLLPTVRDTGCQLVGTAGTVTTLAAMQLEMTCYDWRRVNNLSLETRDLDRLGTLIGGLPPQSVEALPGVEPGRGDLIGPGLDILQSLMQRLDKTGLVVSDFGLLEGLLLDLAGEACVD